MMKKQICIRMCECVKFLHDNHVIHRNIKPDSFVILSTAVYITDFSFAIESQKEVQNSTVVGTIKYISPEILGRQSYTQSVDIYSLLMVLYEIITGEYYYDSCIRSSGKYINDSMDNVDLLEIILKRRKEVVISQSIHPALARMFFDNLSIYENNSRSSLPSIIELIKKYL
ncbi:hypothetical protein WA158_005013 [Blastocystis sp. Blastoise]